VEVRLPHHGWQASTVAKLLTYRESACAGINHVAASRAEGRTLNERLTFLHK
jgi:hypothetical protein